MPRDTQTAPLQDIPFWPDYINRELGGPKRWVVAARLTPRLQRDGHEIAITPRRYAEMQSRHAAEVRAAVRLQMVGVTGSEEMADALLRLPGLRIETENRDWPGSELERRRAEREAEHAEQRARREHLSESVSH